MKKIALFLSFLMLLAAERLPGSTQLKFAEIVAGEFHSETRTICTELSDFRGPVLVRWGHEIEEPCGHCQWARHDAEGYRAACHHFVAGCRRHVTKTAFVRSPKDERSLAAHTPGPDSVNLVGLSLYGQEKMDVDYYGGRRDLVSTLKENYVRIGHFDKPVIMATRGISGTPAYRDNWFDSLFDVIKGDGQEVGLPRSIVYFNDKEPYHWPYGLGSPDWRIAPAFGWFARAQATGNAFASPVVQAC